MAKKEERFEVTFRDGSQLKDEGVRQILVSFYPLQTHRLRIVTSFLSLIHNYFSSIDWK